MTRRQAKTSKISRSRPQKIAPASPLRKRSDFFSSLLIRLDGELR